MKKKDTYNYFDEFIKMAEYIVESAEILNNALKDYNNESLLENINKVHTLENNSDDIVHGIRNYLIKDFLPPIDREYISLIGNRLDDIEDEIDEILINFNILNINDIKEDTYEFGELLIKCCLIVKELIINLKNFKKINVLQEKTIELNKLEEDGDRVFEKAMKNLYRNEDNAIEIIKWTAIYKCFEDAFDACEHIADVIEDTILENS